MYVENEKCKDIPYTYVVTCIPTGKRYYGVRFRKGCHPSDLWVAYFTSCKEIHAEIKKYGVNQFLTEIRKVFDSVNKARQWECGVLRRLKIPNNSKWYNKHNASLQYLSTSQELLVARNRTGKGRKLSLSHRRKISAGLTLEIRARFAELRRKNSGRWIGIIAFKYAICLAAAKVRRNILKLKRPRTPVLPESIEKFRLKVVGRKRPGQSLKMKGRTWSIEHRKLISEGLRNFHRSRNYQYE